MSTKVILDQSAAELETMLEQYGKVRERSTRVFSMGEIVQPGLDLERRDLERGDRMVQTVNRRSKPSIEFNARIIANYMFLFGA